MNEDFEKQRNDLLISGDWPALAELLEAQEGNVVSKDERIDALEELGSIYLEHLQDPAKAYSAWERMFRAGGDSQMIADYCGQILEQFPTFEPALLRLDPILRDIGTIDALKTLVGHYLDVAGACDDQSAFIEYHRLGSKIFMDDLGQPEGAFLVLNAASNVDTLDGPFWDELSELAKLGGMEHDLVDSAWRFLEQATESVEYVELLKKIGFYAMEAEHDEAAIAVFRRAASIRSDRQVKEALTLLYQRRGEWDGVLEELEREMDRAVDRVHQRELFEKYISTLERAAVETSPPDNAKWLATLGYVAAEHQNNRPAAIKYWQKALESNPVWVPALEPLIDEYISEGDWDRALPLLEEFSDIAARDPRRFDSRLLKTRLIQLADAYESKKKWERAVDANRRAYEADPEDPFVMLRYGISSMKTEDVEVAERVLRRLINDYSTALNPSQHALALSVGAKTALAAEHLADARTWIVRSLELEPNNLDAYRTLNRVGIRTNNPEFRLRALERLSRDAPDPSEQFKSRTDLGDVWAGMGRPDRATQSYESALALEPNSIMVLRKLLSLFQEAKRWGAAIAVIDRLAANELDSERRATLLYTMGILARDEVGDAVAAVEHFDRALDEQPQKMLKAFEAIDRILTDARAWSELERAYRRMLTRLKDADPDVLFLLWKNLGEVYRTRLGKLDEAIASFETAISIREEDESLRLILADLYRRTGTSSESAALHINVVLEKDIRQFDSLGTLFRSHLDAQQFDRAFNVAAVLHAFDGGDFEISSFYGQYLGKNLKTARGQFYPELLDAVYHQDLNRYVMAMMSIVTYAIRGPMGRTRKEWGVGKNERASAAKPMSRFEKMFFYFSNLVGPKPETELYVRRDHSLGYRNMQTDPPAILVGNDILEPHDDRRFAFEFAKLLSGLRPEMYLGSGLFSVENLNLFFVSACDFAVGRKPTAGKSGKEIIKHIKALPGPMRTQLASFVSHIDMMNPPDMREFLTLVDHTTSRFGLIVCGDLQTAFRFLKEQTSAPTYASLNERLDELARFCISDEYVRIRKELGLGLQ